MLYFIYSLVLIVFFLIIYRLRKNKKYDLEKIYKLETKIEASLTVNKKQEDKVKLSSELNSKLQEARSIVDQKILDLQTDLIQKSAKKQ